MLLRKKSLSRNNIFCLTCALLLASTSAYSQTPTPAAEPVTTAAAPKTSGQPLEISADQALEWDRQNTKYIARGNAIAKQDDMQVNADLLVADYREGADKKTEIYRLTATGNVVLTSAGTNKAYGEKAIYEVDGAKATLTGGDLRIETPEMKITAKDKFEYYSNEGKMIAYGDPVIVNKDATLTADLVTAWTNKSGEKTEKPPVAKDPNKPQSKLGGLRRAEAQGNVVITTPKEKATGDKGIYTAENDTVELLGNVKLYQGENILEGVRADMNLTTSLSRVYGSEGKGGRVKGIFFPSSQKKSEKTAPTP